MNTECVGETDVKLKDKSPPVTKTQIVLTICLYIAFGTLGLANSLTGPSLVHLSYLYDTDIAGIAVTFTFNSVGYLIGSIICALVFDHANQELQFFLACLDMGLMTAAAPWIPHLYGYFAAMSCANIGKGFIDAAGQSYVISLWHGHRFKNPIMQGIHAIWAVGAFLCPLIIGPFLVDLPEVTESTTTIDNLVINNTTCNETLCTQSNGYTTTIDTDDIEGLTNLRYPYVIVGFIGGALSFSFLLAFCTIKKEKGKHDTEDDDSKGKNLPGNRMSFKVPVLAMQVVFYFFYLWYENIPGGLISAMVIKGLNWPVPSGPRITSLYWGSSGIGRIVGIPVSAILSPTAMLVGNITITSIAFICMCIAANTSDILLWISASMAGFGMSTTFASAILWTSNHMTITGAVGAMFLIAASLGSFTGPALAGFLFDRYSHMWVIYLSLFSCCVHILIFTLLNIFTRLYERKLKRKEDISENINVADLGNGTLKPLKEDEIYSSVQHL